MERPVWQCQGPPAGAVDPLPWPAVLGTARQCSRPGCAELAVGTLTYQYGRAQVWLDALTPERDPHAYDLCQDHATRLSVPLGWHLDDRRLPRAERLLAG